MYIILHCVALHYIIYGPIGIGLTLWAYFNWGEGGLFLLGGGVLFLLG